MREDSVAFENLAKDIIKAENCIIREEVNKSYDLIIEWKSEEFVVEVKYYRTMRAQISLIERAIFHLKRARDDRQDILDEGVGALLIISSFIEPKIKSTIEEDDDIKIIDLADLIKITSDLPHLRERLVTLLEIPDDFINSLVGRGLENILQEDNVMYEHMITCRSPSQIDDDNSSESLISKLNGLLSGKENYKAYEDIMLEVLKYLFYDDLKGWHTQYGSANNLNRYDCVCGIKKNREFWVFLVEQVKSNYILFEFKNYKNTIGQGEVLTTEKYLFENAFRKVALIFSRKGASASALEMCSGAMRESGRLILILNDDDVHEMLIKKDRGEDPSDYLLDKADSFLMKLSR